MNSKEIRFQISRIVAQFFDMGEPPGASNELVLLGDGGVFDSVTALELVLALEEAFGIVIQDEDIRPEHLKSIESIAAFVESALARQSQGAS